MTGQLIYKKQDTSNKLQEIKNKKFTDNRPHFRIDNRIIGGHPSKDWFGKLPTSHTRVVLVLTQGTLFFNDMRVFGWVKQVETKKLDSEFNNYGPDINSKYATPKYFHQFLQRSTQPVKIKIMDQSKVAGIGNIYANDALHLAKINPTRPANSLSKKESDLLLKSCKHVIALGIKYGGASESDFIHLSGAGGKYQKHFRAYKKQGRKCPRNDRGVIKKIKLGGRGTFYCPACQR
jgi:formamidopyrimidine-DNA glycosylase